MNGSEKPPLNKLVHFGVKGMKWNVRRPQNLIPSPQQVKKATVAVGDSTKKAAAKINDAAVYAAHHKQMVAGLAITTLVLHDIGKTAVSIGRSGILIKAAKNRKAAYEAGRIAARSLSSNAAKINYAKMVKGAYKITTM